MAKVAYEQLRKELDGCGFSLPEDLTDKLRIYLELLMKWNRVMNLVSGSDWKLILHDLVLDSFFLGDFLSGLGRTNHDLRILDLGAGAGLPGIPLRLVWNPGLYYLVESRTKRAVFMNQALASMDIKNTSVLNCRIEDIDPELLPVGMVISRAFMPLPGLLPLAKKLLKKNGVLIVLSSGAYQGQELPGFRMIEVMEYRSNRKKRYFWALESNI